MDPEGMARTITPHTKAVIPVHVSGRAANISVYYAEVHVKLPHLLMRLAQELFEQTEFVHQLQGRGMNGVAAKIAQEILVLFQNDHFHAGAREQKAEHHSRWSAASNATACLYSLGSLSGLVHRWVFIHFI
jgi:hypothetical protein